MVQANAQTNWIGRAILALVVAGAATGTHFLFPDTSAIPFTPDQLRGAELSLNTAYLEHMTSQSATAAASQRPVAAGDPLGGVSDAAQGFEFRAGTAVTRPLLTVAAAGFRTGFSFDGTDDRLRLNPGAAAPSNTTAFRWLGDTANWTWHFRHRQTGRDGTTRVLFDNANNTSANRGVSIWCASTNRYRVQVMRGTGSSYIYDYTSSGSIPCSIAGGDREITIIAAGASDGSFQACGTSAGSCVTETMTRTANALSPGLPNTEMIIGATSAGTSPCACDLGQISISRYVETAQEILNWRGYDPPYQSAGISLVRTSTTNGCGVNFCGVAFDFRSLTNGTSLFTDAACTVAAANAGDPIACAIPINDRGPNNRGHLGRNLIIDAAGDEPLYQGSNGASFDGVNDNWDFGPVSGSNIRLEHGISSSYFTLTTCDTTATGCHIMHNSAGIYFARTGSLYSSNPGSGAFCQLHTSGGAPFPDGSCDLPGGGATGSQECLYAYHSARSWTIAGSGAGSNTQDIAGNFQPIDMGDPAFALWRVNGFYRRFIMIDASVPTIAASCP